MNGRWPGVLSRAQVCEYLNCGDDKLRELICNKSLKPVSLPNGKQLLFRLMDLEKFVAGLQEISGSARILERQQMTDAARKARAEKRAAKDTGS